MAKKIVLLLLFLFISSLARDAAATQYGPYAYVTNRGDNNVSVIDTSTDTVVSTIAVGTGPYGVGVSPTGTRAYIANHDSGSVSVIDTDTNTVVATVAVGISPYGVVVNPTGTMAYVANGGSNTVSVIDTTTNTVVASVPVGSWPKGIAVNPSGTRIYVANYASNNISVINTATNTVIATITVGAYPFGIVVNPDGTKAYVADNFSSDVSVIDTVTNMVSAVLSGWDISSSNPFTVAINPSGTVLYVANRISNDVSVIDTSTNTIVTKVAIGTSPVGISVTPDGTKIYIVNNNSNNLSVMDASTNSVVNTIDVGTGPVAFGQFIGPVITDTAAPYSSITSPSDGAVLSGSSCGITGSAGGGSGGLQKVEVGITPNGGSTAWYAAVGTTSWTCSWTPPANGNYTIQSRVTDNAGNVETPGAGITLTVSSANAAGAYTMSTTAYNWIEISETGTNSTLSGDDYDTSLPVGFNFSFFGNQYSSVNVSTNGLAGFSSSGIGAFSNFSLPSPDYPNNIIAAFWDDLYVDGNAAVYYKTIGTAPNRTFVVEWRDLRLIGGSDYNLTFEMLFYEGSNNIVLQYYPGITDRTSATVGIDNADGSAGIQYEYNTANVYGGLAILFSTNHNAPPANSVTLDASAATVAPGNTVTFTAQASGGSGSYEYSFQRIGAGTNWQWVTVQVYSSTAAYSWTPAAGDTGPNGVIVYARNAGSSAASEAGNSYQFQVTDISPVSAVSLTAPLTDAAGTRMTATAQASGGSGSYEYSFQRIGAGTNWQWVTVQAYSSTADYSWTPAVGDAGLNAIIVNARNAGSTSASEAASLVQFQVTGISPVSAASVTAPATNPAGTRMTATAQASGGSGSYEYSFQRIGPGTNWQWVTAQAYSSVATYSWTPAAGDVGTNAIIVNVRNAGSTNASEAANSVQFQVTGIAPVNSVSLNAPATDAVGTQMTATAQASGGSGSYQYSFWRNGPGTGGQWVNSQAYSSSSSYSWTPSASDAGANSIMVYARNAGSSASYEATNTAHIQVSSSSASAYAGLWHVEFTYPNSTRDNVNMQVTVDAAGNAVVTDGITGNYTGRFSGNQIQLSYAGAPAGDMINITFSDNNNASGSGRITRNGVAVTFTLHSTRLNVTANFPAYGGSFYYMNSTGYGALMSVMVNTIGNIQSTAYDGCPTTYLGAFTSNTTAILNSTNESFIGACNDTARMTATSSDMNSGSYTITVNGIYTVTGTFSRM